MLSKTFEMFVFFVVVRDEDKDLALDLTLDLLVIKVKLQCVIVTTGPRAVSFSAGFPVRKLFPSVLEFIVSCEVHYVMYPCLVC